ncbi:30S ribosome-binding factor RbfA [Alkalimarinus sediminis]|uniref:Ribosome-binding factor A n=1 Tax=Alkalimarinus sediminis TaxID=1632866 RepID=A0A9E8HR15_9ALTE|nr:30S ribosome-binding factor RbfA [Alkalimarinus sediminis]UZW74204.1 30S ribosome-binding factor RbfA [Alkalimarinus sediminis]
MPKEFSRTQRVADQIQRELAQLVQTGLKDPRIGMVTINDVRVSRDMGYADVYITVLAAEELNEHSDEIKLTLEVLNKAAGFLRNELGRAIQIRMVPHLRFYFDKTVGEGRRMSSLIDQARSKDQALASKGSDSSPEDLEG